jgi:pyrimidine operon attenuation protein/uracil phosphoribosyltransferase
MEKELLHYQEIQKTIERIAHEIVEKNKESNVISLIGIKKGGVAITRRLYNELLKQEFSGSIELGFIDPRPFRDDENRESTDTSDIATSVTGKNVILVDDVIRTGRTARGALAGIMNYGSPAGVELFVMISSGKRELPIIPTYVGKNIPAIDHERIEFFIHEEIHPEDRIIINEK